MVYHRFGFAILGNNDEREIIPGINLVLEKSSLSQFEFLSGKFGYSTNQDPNYEPKFEARDIRAYLIAKDVEGIGFDNRRGQYATPLPHMAKLQREDSSSCLGREYDIRLCGCGCTDAPPYRILPSKDLALLSVASPNGT